MKSIILFLVLFSGVAQANETCDFRVYREQRDATISINEIPGTTDYSVIHEDFVWEEENSLRVNRSDMVFERASDRLAVETPFLEIANEGPDYLSRIRIEYDQLEKLPPFDLNKCVADCKAPDSCMDGKDECDTTCQLCRRFCVNACHQTKDNYPEYKRQYFRARQKYFTEEGERGQYPDIWIKKVCFQK